MTPLMTRATLGLALAVGLSVPAAADLGDLLGRIPLGLVGGQVGAVVIAADLDAARAAAAEEPGGTERAAWTRLDLLPFALTLQAGLAGGWHRRTGFDPDDVSRVLVVSAPPVQGVALQLKGPPDLTALGEAGYREATRDGLTALARGGADGSMSLADRDPDDPFGGRLGAASRIAVEGASVRQSNTWPMLAALASPAPSPTLAALATALDSGDWGGTPVQAQLWSPLDVAPGLPPDLLAGDPAAPERLLEPGEALPPWSMGLAADLAGEDGIGLVLLAFPDPATAARAAGVLSRRLPEATSMMVNAPLLEAWRVTGEVRAKGSYVAVLLRGGGEGHPFDALLRAWSARDLAPFAAP